MIEMMGGILVPLLWVSMAEAAEPVPWYARDECRMAYSTVMSADLAAGQSAISQLQHSADLELRTCGIWLELPLCEIEMALEGESPALTERRNERLEKLFKFAMHYGPRRPYLLDLAIEARMRRIRLMVDRGDKGGALGEARKVEKMLESRKDAPPNATRDYSRGVTLLAVSRAAWGLQALLRMAGVRGDRKRGEELLEALAEGHTVYQADALFLLYHFARQNDKPGDQGVDRYGAKLILAYGQNPQFLFDRAVDQFRAGHCIDALATLQPARSRLHDNPKLWTARVRKKVYWLTGRCALDTGDKPLAKKSLGLASQEKFGGYAEEVEILQRDLSG